MNKIVENILMLLQNLEFNIICNDNKILLDLKKELFKYKNYNKTTNECVIFFWDDNKNILKIKELKIVLSKYKKIIIISYNYEKLIKLNVELVSLLQKDISLIVAYLNYYMLQTIEIEELFLIEAINMKDVNIFLSDNNFFHYILKLNNMVLINKLLINDSVLDEHKIKLKKHLFKFYIKDNDLKKAVEIFKDLSVNFDSEIFFLSKKLFTKLGNSEMLNYLKNLKIK